MAFPGGPVQAERRSQMAEILARFNNICDRLQDAQSRMESRLAGVLRPILPVSVPQIAVDKRPSQVGDHGPSVPLVDAFEAHLNRISDVCDRLEMNINHLEV